MKTRALAYLLLVGLFAMAGRLSAEPPAPGKLLPVRPDVPMVKMDSLRRGGYIVWSPTLTLSQAIEIAGGFDPKVTTIMITRWSEDPAPDAQFSKKRYLEDARLRDQILHPYDRVTLTFFPRL
jgi:hypothetical protein